MRVFGHRLLRKTSSAWVVKQGPLSSNDPAAVQGFYSSFQYDDFGVVDVPDLETTLLPFQKEGVHWMMLRERDHSGGIMADHLGMGKTVQMIGLCLSSHLYNKTMNELHFQRAQSKATGYRLLTILRQLQRISVVANCSKINQPASDIRTLVNKVEEAIIQEDKGVEEVRHEVDKWLKFAGKFHSTYEKRAKDFLDDEQKRSFDLIDSKELRTLVVVPAALMLQWKSEIESKVKKSRGLKIYLYYGKSKLITGTELELYDFVITTYDTLTNSALEALVPMFDNKNDLSFSRMEAGPLFHVRWKRIILDEAHMIRHSRTQRWRAVKELQGLHRWAVTATPLHNTIEDIQNLLHFVGLPKLPILPGCNPEELLKDPILQRGIARSLQPAFLRRGPVMIRNGKTEVLVSLPSKTETVVMKRFSPEESKQYNNILARSRTALATSEHKEGAFHIFAMMTRLRQACCHPWISEGRALSVSICGICRGEAVSTVKTNCGHHFCHECILLRFREAVDGDDMAARLPCPICGATITNNSIFKNHSLSSAERILKFEKREMEMSTKLQMILDCINTMREKYTDDKMIIFSHFTSFMDVISVTLNSLDIPHLRLDGTMSLTNRNIVIHRFQTSEEVRIILASKTATGVGLNLTAANHVLVVDPWWNPAIEEQAVHRCYRIGQKKHVHVTRIIIEDTIEQYCYEICQRKKEFGDAILRAATKGDTDASAASSKLRELLSRLQYVPENERRGHVKGKGVEEGEKG